MIWASTFVSLMSIAFTWYVLRWIKLLGKLDVADNILRLINARYFLIVWLVIISDIMLNMAIIIALHNAILFIFIVHFSLCLLHGALRGYHPSVFIDIIDLLPVFWHNCYRPSVIKLRTVVIVILIITLIILKLADMTQRSMVFIISRIYISRVVDRVLMLKNTWVWHALAAIL